MPWSLTLRGPTRGVSTIQSAPAELGTTSVSIRWISIKYSKRISVLNSESDHRSNGGNSCRFLREKSLPICCFNYKRHPLVSRHEVHCVIERLERPRRGLSVRLRER